MSRTFGFEKLAEQVAEFLLGEWEWQSQEGGAMTGNSPIEKLLFKALTIVCNIGASEFTEVTIAHSQENVDYLRTVAWDPGAIRLIVWPQAPFENRRVDFIVFAPDWSNPDAPLRRLIVECDGHDYHERTKEQAAKDRSKDRHAVLSGIESFRFTGSEIWRDPWDCAAQILDWATKDFGR